MSKLAFLSNITVVGEDKPKNTNRGARKNWNPENANRAAIRLWYDGSVYPSQGLVDRFDLEYSAREVDDSPVADIVPPGPGVEPAEPAKVRFKPINGNGFDVADSEDFKAFQTPQRLLIAALTPKAGLKVDLFGSVGYDDNDNPLIGVMDQGANTFGKTFLIPSVEEIYGLKFKVPGKAEKKDEQGNVIASAVEEVAGLEYVDLLFLGVDGENSSGFRLPEGKSTAFLPKRVSRGEKRGETTVVRRVNPELFVLYPASLIDEAGTTTE